jgi:cell division protein FtsI/penicillin-binding protein 2
MSVGQASRMVGAIATGGVYRKCPPSMEKGAVCAETRVLQDGHLMAPVLAGMEQVMLSGTARGLLTAPGIPPGIRLYGKTGTADSIGIEEEIPWGIEKGVYGKPHAWFVSIAEPITNGPSCQPTGARRIVVAAVVPRSGLGAVFAGPAGVEIVSAAYTLGYFGDPRELEKAAAALPPPAPPRPAATPSPAPTPSP